MAAAVPRGTLLVLDDGNCRRLPEYYSFGGWRIWDVYNAKKDSCVISKTGHDREF